MLPSAPVEPLVVPLVIMPGSNTSIHLRVQYLSHTARACCSTCPGLMHRVYPSKQSNSTNNSTSTPQNLTISLTSALLLLSFEIEKERIHLQTNKIHHAIVLNMINMYCDQLKGLISSRNNAGKVKGKIGSLRATTYQYMALPFSLPLL